jgi:hypothetical protein
MADFQAKICEKCNIKSFTKLLYKPTLGVFIINPVKQSFLIIVFDFCIIVFIVVFSLLHPEGRYESKADARADM